MKKLSIKISLVALYLFVFTPFSYADDYSPPMVHQIYFTYDGEPYNKEIKYTIDCIDTTFDSTKEEEDGPPIRRTFSSTASCPKFGCKTYMGGPIKYFGSNYCYLIGSSIDGYFLVDNVNPSFYSCGANDNSVRTILSEKGMNKDSVSDCYGKLEIDKCLNDLEEIVNPDSDEYYNDFYYSTAMICNVFINIPYDSFTKEKPLSKTKEDYLKNGSKPIVKDEQSDNNKIEKIVDNEAKEKPIKVIANEKDKVVPIADIPSPESEKTTGDDNNGGTNTILEISISENKILYILFIVIVGLLGFIIFRKK